MGRKFIDCREYPSEMNCTLALSADKKTNSWMRRCNTRSLCMGTRTRRIYVHDPNCDEGWNAAGRGTAAGGLGVVRPDVC